MGRGKTSMKVFKDYKLKSLVKMHKQGFYWENRPSCGLCLAFLAMQRSSDIPYQKLLRHVLHSSRAGAALLCTETIVFIHWQTPNQTMSHAKHSWDFPPAANSTGWEMLLPVHHAAFKSAQHPSQVYIYDWLKKNTFGDENLPFCIKKSAV